MTSRSGAELAVVLDRTNSRPLPIQLADGVRARIVSGTLAPGDSMPSTRFLASRLHVARGTVVAAYDQLLGEGYLLAAQGRPTTVHPALERIHPMAGRAPAADPVASAAPSTARTAVRRRGRTTTDPGPSPIDLRPGTPDASGLQGAAWRAAWRRAAVQPLPATPDPAGLAALRAGSAEHLRLMRALPVSADRLVITAGAREGLGVLLAALAAHRGRPRLRVGVESPGYPTLRTALTAQGHLQVPCPVDDGGLRIESLPVGEQAPDALIVTPSHQYPRGGSLALRRRLELLEWAQRWEVLVVEDDFDSELRYVGAPLPTLSALDPTGERTALLGTFSTLLTPALATGYLALPESLQLGVLRLRAQLGMPVSTVTQHAVADLLETGQLRRHTRRMRSVYARRRERVRAAFDTAVSARLAPMHGGVDALVTTADSEDVVVDRCRAAGLIVGRQSAYWAGTPGAQTAARGERVGIVVGFARADEDVLTRALPALVAACDGP